MGNNVMKVLNVMIKTSSMVYEIAQLSLIIIIDVR